MMPTPAEQRHIEEKAELIEDMQKLKQMIIGAAVLAFGCGFATGAILI